MDKIDLIKKINKSLIQRRRMEPCLFKHAGKLIYSLWFSQTSIC